MEFQALNTNILLNFIEVHLEILKLIEKYNVYFYLLNVIEPNTFYGSRVQRWCSTLLQIKWFSFPIVIYVTMSVIAVLSILLSKTVFLYVTITIFVLLLLHAAIIMVKGICRNKSNRELIGEKFLRMQRNAGKNFYIIICLRNNTRKETLKSLEQDFENENKQLQARANFLSKLIPFLTIIIIVLFLNINIEPEVLNDSSLLYNMFKGSAGLYTLFVLILNLYNELLLKSQYDINNRCLYLLKTAQT